MFGALRQVLKSRVGPLILFRFFEVALDIINPSNLHIHFKIRWSVSIKNSRKIMIEIVLHL